MTTVTLFRKLHNLRRGRPPCLRQEIDICETKFRNFFHQKLEGFFCSFVLCRHFSEINWGWSLTKHTHLKNACACVCVRYAWFWIKFMMSYNRGEQCGTSLLHLRVWIWVPTKANKSEVMRKDEGRLAWFYANKSDLKECFKKCNEIISIYNRFKNHSSPIQKEG